MGAVALVIVVIGAPIAYLAWRLRREEAAPGGSQGKQIFGRQDDEWGPKP
jgi:hypothetical protein